MKGILMLSICNRTNNWNTLNLTFIDETTYR